MPEATPEQRLAAQAHVAGLLNEIESVLAGWVLKIDRDTFSKHVDALYALVDRD